MLLKNGFLYLVAIMDWATRKVLSWRLNNTMHTDFCVEALNEAGVRISMDGRGRYLDNIFIERLWRSLKQEAIYLEEIRDGFQAQRAVKNWMAFYNTERPHPALDRRTPKGAYWTGLEEQKSA